MLGGAGASLLGLLVVLQGAPVAEVAGPFGLEGVSIGPLGLRGVL